jgi:hypothetical protein
MWFCRTNDIVQKKDIIEHDHDVFVWIDWRILSSAYRTARSPHVFPDLMERLEAAISAKECDVQSGDEPFSPGLTLQGSCDIVRTDGGGIIPAS